MPPFPRQAIVLAAGLGTRLKPLTLKIPKPALPLGGVPILLYNLFLLKESGVDRITINLHHRPEAIRQLFGEGRPLGLKLAYSYEPKILGTAGGIAQALAEMKPGPTFVLNGDILMDLDLKKMSAEHFRTKARATLACVARERAKVTSFVEYDKMGRIWRIAGNPPWILDSANSSNLPRAEAKLRLASFSKGGNRAATLSSPPFEKGGPGGIFPKPAPRLTSAIFTGAHLLDPALFAGYPRHQFGCVIRQVYQPALERGERLQAYRHPSSWWDLGTLEELKNVDFGLWTRGLPLPVLELWEQVRRWARPLF